MKKILFLMFNLLVGAVLQFQMFDYFGFEIIIRNGKCEIKDAIQTDMSVKLAQFTSKTLAYEFSTKCFLILMPIFEWNSNSLPRRNDYSRFEIFLGSTKCYSIEDRDMAVLIVSVSWGGNRILPYI